jgi:hypothetical protein
MAMAKQKTGRNVAAFALQFVGSLFFLAVVAALYVPSSYAAGAGWAAASLWIPLLYAVAVVASIALFLVSFGQLGGVGGGAYKARGASAVAGVSLVALTAGNTTLFVASLIGLILGLIGSAASSGCRDCM